MTQILLCLLIGLLIGFAFGWGFAHNAVATECDRLGSFFVGEKVYECKLKKHWRKAMTDRELLEMAAKAANAEFEVSDEEGVYLHQPIGGVSGFWDPLTDDGDALRLAVKLGIHLMHSKHKIKAGRKLIQDGPCEEDKGADPYAATRRAIVRAAAEIGKAMP